MAPTHSGTLLGPSDWRISHADCSSLLAAVSLVSGVFRFNVDKATMRTNMLIGAIVVLALTWIVLRIVGWI